MATYSGALTKKFTRVGPVSAGGFVGGAGTYTVNIKLAGPASQSPSHVIPAGRTASIRQIFVDATGSGSHVIYFSIRRYNPFTSTWVSVGSDSFSFSGSAPVYTAIASYELDENDMLMIYQVSSTNGNMNFQISFLVEENYPSF